MSVQLGAEQDRAIEHVEVLLLSYYRKHNPSYLAANDPPTGAADMSATAIAKQEADGWRGQIIDATGNVLTRTINLYPTADKAISGANRLWEFKQAHDTAKAPGKAP